VRPQSVGRRRTDGVARRILVVDDNPLNGMVAKAMLGQDGHEVLVVSDGVEALAAVQERSFDLVLMDMQMPVMSGVEATRRIRALASPLSDIPIVALSANVMAREVAICRDAGMNDYLAKPIDRDLLRQIVATWTAGCDARPDAAPRTPLSEREIAHNAPPDNEQPAFEMNALLDLFDGDRLAVAGILAIALASVQSDSKTIVAGTQAHDAAAVIAAAHHLKGTCADLRATRLRDVAALIEQVPKTTPWTVTESSLAELGAAAAALSRALEIHTAPANLVERRSPARA
jgi:CheY-like chemotaxis protein/HPt (histidine-containing phosphotransfer) domain-containing protein